jgi:hypothetical protein
MEDLTRLREALGKDDDLPPLPKSNVQTVISEMWTSLGIQPSPLTTDPTQILARLRTFAEPAGWAVRDGTADFHRGDTYEQHQPDQPRLIVFFARCSATEESYSTLRNEVVLSPMCSAAPAAVLVKRDGPVNCCMIPTLEAFSEAAFQSFIRQ